MQQMATHNHAMFCGYFLVNIWTTLGYYLMQHVVSHNYAMLWCENVFVLE